MESKECVFCKIVRAEIPTYKLYEDENFIVILDIHPQSTGHMLVIPKGHYDNIYEIEEEKMNDLMKVTKRMAVLLKEKFSPEGLNIIQNNGTIAGQTVMHFHMHIIPKYEDKKENEKDIEKIYTMLVNN